MPNLLLFAILLIATLGSIVAGLLIRAEMVAEINSKRDARSRLSFLERDFIGMLALHRQLFPKSNLRIATVLAVALSIAFGLSFTIVQGIQR